MKKCLLGIGLLVALGLGGCQGSDDIFEKNKECYSYKNKITEVEGEKIDGVFYSEQKDSCLFILKKSGYSYLKDLFSGEIIVEYHPGLARILIEGQEIENHAEEAGSFEKIIENYK